MSKLTRIATPLIAVSMMCSLPTMVLAQTAPAPAPAPTQTSATPNWKTPPAGSEQAQKAYLDGLLAMKVDKAANRKVDAKSSHQYVHPPVRGVYAQTEYRTAFVSGYEAAMQHDGTASGE
jgi:hypothetical protein